MCGICCTVCLDCGLSRDNARKCQTFISDRLLSALRRRGPDYSKFTDVPLVGDTRHLQACACTLRMRGPPLKDDSQAQPLTDENGRVFLWNGEVFGGGVEVNPGDCDTLGLFATLSTCDTDDDILFTLKSIKGPFAFIYFDSESLWFGRDFFGRRSLLWSISDYGEDGGNKRMALCSVADATSDTVGSLESGGVEVAWQEVPAKGIFKFRFLSLFRFQLEIHCSWSPGIFES